MQDRRCNFEVYKWDIREAVDRELWKNVCECEYGKQLYHQPVPERKESREELLMIHTDFLQL